ncbi:MAG: insulinase family protein [Candidatus Rokubacteria bacterium]|nr:insulinase family protein [Candidatus Rokubacteria bacterium]
MSGGNLAGAVVAAVLLAAPPAVGAPGAMLRDRLPNGLTLIVRENPAAPVVAVSLLVRVGSGWERESNAGITNLLQQVMVKGTQRRSALEIAEAAEGMGGSVSASADMDFSEIGGSALARHWRALLDLVADVALQPALATTEIEGERRLVLSTIRTRADQPFQRALEVLRERLYGSHPYALPSLGRPEVVARLDREALLEHHRRYYRAGRTVVSVSGQLSAPEVAAEIARLFAAMPPGEGEAAAPSPVASVRAERAIVRHAAAQAQVLAGVLAPPMDHGDYAAVKVLSTALGGGMAGRLFTELRDRQGLAYSTGAFYPSRAGRGMLVAYLGTAPGNAEKAEEGMRMEIARLGQERLSAAEVSRAKAYLLGQFALDRRTNARLAWYQAFFEAAGVGHDFAERYARAVEAVTADDLQRVARVYLAAPTVVSLRPPGQ